MENCHLASRGCLLYRGLGGLRLFILEIIIIGFFSPDRGGRLPFRNYRICGHGSFLTGGRGEAGIGQGPVLTQPCPAPGTEVGRMGQFLSAVMAELG